MDILAELQSGNLLVIGLACCALAVIGTALLFGLQLITGLVSAIGALVDVIVGIVGGGPTAWCGCLLAVIGCGACAGGTVFMANLLAACGTPQATNFCTLFGR